MTRAHEHGVIHRDVKPHNIMIDPDGGVHLLDFGLARGVGLDMKTITASGMIVGTPEYMSPEQFEGSRVDARSDIYSLGVVVFQMLTGTLPFERDTPMALALKHTQQTPPDPRTIREDLPPWLGRIILRCLEEDPRKRYPDANELDAGPPERWLYHFDHWPESEVFRKVVDYEEHCAEMRARPKGLAGKLKKFLR